MRASTTSAKKMFLSDFPSHASASAADKRAAQLLGRSDAAYDLRHYFEQCTNSHTPIKIPLPASALTLRRDLTAGNAPGGGYLVGTQTLGVASYLEGYDPTADAQVISGLTAPVLIPKVNTLPASHWITEGATITESQPSFGQLALEPKWLTVLIDLSRQLNLQSPAAEGVIKTAIAEQFRRALVAAMLGGSGAAGQPRGLASTPGVNTVSGTSLGAGGIRDMIEGILNAGGRLDRIRWYGSPAVWKLLASREFSTGSGRPIADKGMIEGQPFTPIAQAPASTLIAVDMGRVVIALFDGVGTHLIVNPYANFHAGVVAYRLLVGVDVGLLTAGACSVASSVT